MDFATLKSSVESAMGRSDVPDYVYTLATAGVNRDMRLLDMESTTTLTGSSATISLPANFGSIRSIYTLVGGDQRQMQAVTDHASVRYLDSGAPVYYSIRDGALNIVPEPDGEYTYYLNYVTKLADFSADGDTNDVIARYPDLFLYQALLHAAIWAQNTELADTYASAFTAARDRANKDDRKRRFGTPIKTRSARPL